MSEAVNVGHLLDMAAEKMGCHKLELSWWCWPQTFGNTSGPRGGIGGQAMTEFQVFAFKHHWSGAQLKWCAGVWKEWDGIVESRW